TYVYLRTIHELARRYGYRKFIIVVPSVAVREGVKKAIDVTGEHFGHLYGATPVAYSVYDSKRLTRLRQFATSTGIEVLTMNIDAFRKNFAEGEGARSNVIYRDREALQGETPIAYIQATRPVVIIDEPQSVDSTEKSQEAIKALNPLMVLRYSATHRTAYSIVYRLDPVRAAELRLVKRIVVGTVSDSEASGEPYLRLDAVDAKRGLRAALRLHARTPDGVREKVVRVSVGDDLGERGKGLALYAGLVVAELSAEPGASFARFTNGTTLTLGESRGGRSADVWKAQVRATVKRHLERELQLRGRGIKVLSLFFVDRVAQYRTYDTAGVASSGPMAEELEAILRQFAADSRYKDIEWLRLDTSRLHGGYFAADRKGVLKDTRGDSAADDSAYDLIMTKKEQLLSESEPLRFIVSHSALREGWDNPNVFQICTLGAGASTVKKRQEIGRGLRLPVDQTGARVRDEAVNTLFVMANESYESFARALQSEYEEDCGVVFGRVTERGLAGLLSGDYAPERAHVLFDALVAGGYLDTAGRITEHFKPGERGFAFDVSDEFTDVTSALVDYLAAHQIERHVGRERDEGVRRLRKEVLLSEDFRELWERIRPRTTFRVEFDSKALVERVTAAIATMPAIEPPKLRFVTGAIRVEGRGVTATTASVSEESVSRTASVSDVLGHLQDELGLTRASLAAILLGSGRLSDATVNPERFVEAVVVATRRELARLKVDGVKYERAEGPDAAWEMTRFKSEELINYLDSLRVKRSIYDYVVFDSEVEHRFAASLDERADIRLFVKLPDWFQVETPVGKYNPDWAIVKHDDETLYLVRETKATRDLFALRSVEADKVRCGARHFEAIGVDFAAVTSADEL
ncbi:MAG: DEAD/DEAH box helicase family protein, partial [Myxococcales bacterium]|nr:DEAD/DEAH box helicase family protein [Myxococcales bacterium]